MLSLVLSLAFLASCSPADTADVTSATAPERPADFTLRYQWEAPSLPPPYGYQIRVSVDADGSGTAQFRVYGADAPVWTEPFRATAEQMDETYRAFCESGVYATRWWSPTDLPVGASTWRLVTTANGERVEIPEYALSSPARSLDPVVDAVEEIVPRSIWQRLEAKRNAYLADQTPNGPSVTMSMRR